MIQPKRYRPAIDDGSREPWMKESELGGYVEYADYAAVKAEVDALREAGRMLCEYINEEMCEWEGNKMTDEWHKVDKWDAQMSFNYSALQAENERLRKAGDAMENELFRVILMELPGLEKEDINNQYIADWRAAKGVKP
ncbi:MAG: hypothetical protein ACK5VI_04350 [Opitutia bacterium]